MTFRIGVDIGGTFTDFALVDDATGQIVVHKQLTTPSDPSIAFLEGVATILRLAGTSLAEVERIIHGTTLVTNAVIERKGVRTGLLVTRGFADTLDIARESRYDLFDLRIAFPAPVVARNCRFEIPERISYAGEVLDPLDLSSIEAALDHFIRSTRIEAVAICLLHSYLDDRHELELEAWLRRRFPDLSLSVSSAVFPFMREYERWTTACLNAYVQPIVDRYLHRLQASLRADGYRGGFHLVSSSGGTLSLEIARRFPIRLLESGPAAGALMSANHGETLGLDQLLSFDMGGTTAKGCIIRDARPLKKYDFEVARIHEFRRGSGLPVKIPVIDMIEIGAGGGSIAAVDERGVLQVGPRSAGAVPGPACYGQGGTLPTLTDANLLLGYLDPAAFLGGKMPIDRDAAAAAVSASLAGRLATDVTHTAWGIHEVINEQVARAFRIHASEQGVDYRHCTMVAFGGSGPIHALRVARKLKIPRVVCPTGAGVMSALGMLISPLSFEVVRSRRMQGHNLGAAMLGKGFAALDAAASRFLVDAGALPETIVLRRRLDMRYEGQGYEVEVALPEDQPMERLAADLAQLFATAYRRVFQIDYPEQPIEIVNWKVEAVGPRPAAGGRYLSAASRPPGSAGKGRRRAFFPEADGFVETPVFDRYALSPGDAVEGPALIEENESTCVVGPGDRVTVDAHCNLIASFGAGP
jgi:N-methylhydantoinase A